MSISKKQDLIDQLQELNNNASLAEIDEAIIKFFKNEPEYQPWRSKFGGVVFAVAILLALFTMGLTLFTCYETPILICYGCWIMLPPGWFMLEYVTLFPAYYKFSSNHMADLKYVHGLAGKVWAGMVVVMGLVIIHKFPIKL